jgi:hypothetical protein
MNRNLAYQVSVHLAKQFRGEEFLKSANQKQESPVVAMFVNGSERIGMSNLYRMNRYLVGSTYGRFCIKFPQSRMKCE